MTTTPIRCPLGLASGAVTVVPYDSAWPDLFEAERDRIFKAVAHARVDLRIEHMGSTAVPGLAAKPVLDMLAAPEHDGRIGDAIGAVEGADYVYRGEQGIRGRHFFRRGNPRQYHLHLTTLGSVFWRHHLAFRDYVRAHADVAAEYARLKVRLAETYPRDREAYIEGKTEFVARVLAAAGER